MSINYKSLKAACGFGVFALALFGTFFAQNAISAEPEIAAKTAMIVIDAEFIREGDASPSEVIHYDVTHYLRNADYSVPGLLTWEWGALPGYDPLPPGATPLTARIWAWKTQNGGVTYEGIGWDYILNSTGYKHRAQNVPDWVGTMISSLCHTNSTCNGTERTNIDFFPGNTTEYDNINGTELISLKITPNDVGVFYQNKTQQFKAIGVTPDGTVVDLTKKVDWSIDPEGFPYKSSDQNMDEGAIATIDNEGLATVHDTWGRVMVNVCYPRGCNGGVNVTSATSILLLNTTQ
jgi:hypothetical protein